MTDSILLLDHLMPHFEVSNNVLKGNSLTSCRDISEDDGETQIIYRLYHCKCYLQGKLSALRISIIPVFLDERFMGGKLIGIGARVLVLTILYVCLGWLRLGRPFTHTHTHTHTHAHTKATLCCGP